MPTRPASCARLGVDSAESLRAFSFERTADFWDAVVDDLELEFDVPYSRTFDDSQGREWVRWFVDGKLNVARVCLDRWAADDGEVRALTWESERGERRELELDGAAKARRRRSPGRSPALGVGGGDTVGLFMPMTPETVAAYYAVAKLGAIAMPIFSGFGAEAVAVRLRDAERVAAGHRRRLPSCGQGGADEGDRRRAPSSWRRRSTVVVVPRLGADVPWDDGRDVAWDGARQRASPDRSTRSSVDSRRTRCSSLHERHDRTAEGRRARPRRVAREGRRGGRLPASICGAGDRLFWLTDLGWIMGPWTIVGTPRQRRHALLYRRRARLARPDRACASRCSDTGSTCSASARPGSRADGARRRTAVARTTSRRCACSASTGEPWNADACDWYFDEVGGGRCPVINISGGTEVGGCFLSPPMPATG